MKITVKSIDKETSDNIKLETKKEMTQKTGQKRNTITKGKILCSLFFLSKVKLQELLIS